MLYNFSKCLEIIIKNRLIQFLERYKLLLKKQFDFRPGLGSEGAHYDVSSYLSNALVNKKKTFTIFLDLSKKFTVNHDNLKSIFQVLE